VAAARATRRSERGGIHVSTGATTWAMERRRQRRSLQQRRSCTASTTQQRPTRCAQSSGSHAQPHWQRVAGSKRAQEARREYASATATSVRVCAAVRPPPVTEPTRPDATVTQRPAAAYAARHQQVGGASIAAVFFPRHVPRWTTAPALPLTAAGGGGVAGVLGDSRRPRDGWCRWRRCGCVPTWWNSLGRITLLLLVASSTPSLYHSISSAVPPLHWADADSAVVRLISGR
jgi:hypothetical protein